MGKQASRKLCGELSVMCANKANNRQAGWPSPQYSRSTTLSQQTNCDSCLRTSSPPITNMAESSSNPLISSKPSDSGLHVQLHPLVLLTISDHITRHTARQQQDPIVGALLGQQQGREISLEYAFECHTITGPNDEILLHQTWFEERVKQCTTNHRASMKNS